MAKKFGCLFTLVNVLQMLHWTSCESENLQEKFTTKCDELCSAGETEIKQYSGRAECLRGCQYFNIEFLTNARNKGKEVDLNKLVEHCGASCQEAYADDRTKREKCFSGCNQMMALQAKAPYINGWLVYMGAADRNMVLMQPDFDVPSKEDWVLLDSMFRTNDYEYDSTYNGYGKYLSESHDKYKTIPIYAGHQQFTINYCIPTWMWMVPLLLLLAFIWMHYSNYIYSVFIREGLEQEFGLSNTVNLSGAAADGPSASVARKKCKQDDYVVGSDFYFYPSPAIPPPKYNEAAEAILMGNSDEEDNGNNNDRGRNTDKVIKTANKSNNTAEMNI